MSATAAVHVTGQAGSAPSLEVHATVGVPASKMAELAVKVTVFLALFPSIVVCGTNVSTRFPPAAPDTSDVAREALLNKAVSA